MANVLQPSKATKEQLSPIATKLREGRAAIRPVSQVVLRLRAAAGKDRFSEAVGRVIPWMSKRAGGTLPKEAWQQKSFELSDIGAQRVAAIALSNPRYWTARVDDACKEVASRTWITEVGVGVLDSGDVLFGSRLICATRGADAPIERTIPGFVRAIIGSGAADLDGIELQQTPRFIASESDVADLVSLLEEPERQSDVVVFALPEGSTNPSETVIPIQLIHEKIQSVAHVFIISGPASYYLTDAVGRELSVFRHAARIYRPGFRAWMAQPCNHPLALPARIADWDNKGKDAFAGWLIDQALARSVRGRNREDRLPPFNTVRQLAAVGERKSLRDAGGTDAEMLKLYEQDNEQLRRDLKEQEEQYAALLTAAEVERDSAIQQANTAKAHSLQRSHRIRLLESRLSSLDDRREVPIPESLDEFEAWCKEHLSGTVEVLGRACQAVRKSGFRDPPLVYRSLLVLRDQFVPMLIEGTPERVSEYRRALQELDLEETPTGDAIKYAADTYSVQYGSGRRPLDRHLKGSSSRDKRFGFRVYFFWDDEDQVAVVV